jgi:hypothetical protein
MGANRDILYIHILVWYKTRIGRSHNQEQKKYFLQHMALKMQLNFGGLQAGFRRPIWPNQIISATIPASAHEKKNHQRPGAGLSPQVAQTRCLRTVSPCRRLFHLSPHHPVTFRIIKSRAGLRSLRHGARARCCFAIAFRTLLTHMQHVALSGS